MQNKFSLTDSISIGITRLTWMDYPIKSTLKTSMITNTYTSTIIYKK